MVAQESISLGLHFPITLTILLFGGITSLIIGLIDERLGIKKLREVWVFLISLASLGSVYILYQQLKKSPGEII
ncbi:MAG: hypothetical protein ACLFVP_08205, partial [Candidatus Bathyarchaeia archaeon]